MFTVQMFVGFLKMRRRVIIHASFPNPASVPQHNRHWGGREEGASGCMHHWTGRHCIPPTRVTTAKQAQNKALSDRDVSIVVCTLHSYLHVSHFKSFWTLLKFVASCNRAILLWRLILTAGNILYGIVFSNFNSSKINYTTSQDCS